jgi:ethanolamine utilization protein EutN
VRLAKVVGTAVSTAKERNLVGLTLLVCAPCTSEGKEEPGQRFIGVDTVGAGVGEVVIVATGSAARVTDRTGEAPTDATVVGIVDAVHLDGRTTYMKGD